MVNLGWDCFLHDIFEARKSFDDLEKTDDQLPVRIQLSLVWH